MSANEPSTVSCIRSVSASIGRWKPGVNRAQVDAEFFQAPQHQERAGGIAMEQLVREQIEAQGAEQVESGGHAVAGGQLEGDSGLQRREVASGDPVAPHAPVYFDIHQARAPDDVYRAFLALWIRVWHLDQRPMHADEANQAVKAGNLLEGRGYAFDPADHHGRADVDAAAARMNAWPQFTTRIDDLWHAAINGRGDWHCGPSARCRR